MPGFTELYLQDHISNLMPSANVTIISDLDVHNRNIFNDNTITSNRYDVIILGHQEYVTQRRVLLPKTIRSKWRHSNSSI